MDENPPILLYLNVPAECQDALPLLNLKLPHFSRTLKRIMKKLSKGVTSVEKPLLMETSDGHLEPSLYVLRGESNSENSDFLFARLSNGNTGNEVYQLPFTRFSVRKQSDASSVAGGGSKPDIIDRLMEKFSDRLDHIDWSLSTLSTAVQPASKRKSTAPVKKVVPTSQADSSMEAAGQTSTPIARTTKALFTTPKRRAQSQIPHSVPNVQQKMADSPSAPSTQELKRTKKKQNQAPTEIVNPEFAASLDRTINKVLHRLNEDKSVKSLIALEQRMIETSVERAIPPLDVNHVDQHDHGGLQIESTKNKNLKRTRSFARGGSGVDMDT